VATARRPLFDRYPGTRALPWVSLAELPTPVSSAPALAEAAGAAGVWIKRDDLSGAVYGGNKVRKLEFLVGEALAAGATDIVTFGAAGSNHALATAIYGGAHGIEVHSMLIPQPNARYVRRNVAAAIAAGADLHHYPDQGHMMRGTVRLLKRLNGVGRRPFVIPFGGTTPTSTAGFVNAALELASQVESGVLPEPDLAFVALGSWGTSAGVALGLRAAGMRTRVVAVPVVSEGPRRADDLVATISSAQAALRGHDPAFPEFEWGPGDFDVTKGFLGEEYARFTPAGMEAVRLVEERAGVHLEGTYTGKAFSALLARGRAGALKSANVLFWDTYNSRDLSGLIGQADPARIPARFRAYFDEPVQELDREG
jgi:1-aminocyclopropane-1-carboxylate deaminase/D-cysteine desulfhydrase-like pyridoxal-dependent ACC family enzyme